MKKVSDFFKKSYEDKLAFYSELAETILLVTGSAVLAFTILDPATKIFVPLPRHRKDIEASFDVRRVCKK